MSRGDSRGPGPASARARRSSIPRPDLVSIDPAVDPARIEAGAEILPGRPDRGPRTLIGRGSRIGSAGPAYVRNCAIGRDVELASGTFEGASSSTGPLSDPSAQARPGTLFEERARAAHTVGTKHTILLPYVTLGSLINFCDCLMSGRDGRLRPQRGRQRIHPLQLHARRGQGDAVAVRRRRRGASSCASPASSSAATRESSGPLRVGYGSVLAAGVGLPPRLRRRDARARRRRRGPNRGRIDVERHPRRAAEGAEEPRVPRRARRPPRLPRGRSRAPRGRRPVSRRRSRRRRTASIAESIAERIRQLQKFGAVLSRSAAKLGAGASRGRPSSTTRSSCQRGFAERLSRLEQALSGTEALAAADRRPGPASWPRPSGGAEYLDWVRGLPDAATGEPEGAGSSPSARGTSRRRGGTV